MNHTSGKCACGHYHPYSESRHGAGGTVALIQAVGYSYQEYDALKLLVRAMPAATTEKKGDDLV